ncbi:MAG TPA: ribonuclease Y, partial [Nocardioidaceae bacterium]|nr:ribonuclease Y [Nocardioidaceae bacterium]
MALGSGELLVFLGLLLVIATAVLLWLSRRAPTHALDEVRNEARREADRSTRQLDQLEADRAELSRMREDVERRESRLAERSDRLDAKLNTLEERSESLSAREADLERKRDELLDIKAERTKLLEGVAGLSASDAKSELIAEIENDAKRDAMRTVREIERSATEEGDALAKRILTTTIQRLAAGQTAESVVTVVPLPGGDMKGRIIGREGRNVRTFEQVTGVNVIIDDTPDAVLLSCFDPVRRETARVALEQLVVDGRIHPSRIEEVFEQSQAEVDRLCVRAGEDTAVEFGISDLHPELIRTMGQLRYRTSYGQNVLDHLRESAHLAGLMADEIGLDRTLCVRGALLHDIGKALTHEAEGSHALVGADLARRYGESDDVVHAIEAHHNEVEPRTVEAILVQAADAISGSRPGARRESLESYVKRLKRLEAIAGSKPGVDRVYAMQAGREVRVMVLPDEVDDIQAQVLARDIAKEYEEELTYPGQIKVVVVRESRST